MKLGQRLAELRKNAKFGNQELLGRELGVTKNTIWHYESGRTLPDLDWLAGFARLTGANLGELIQLRLEAGGHEDAAEHIGARTDRHFRFQISGNELQNLRRGLTVCSVPTEWALLITELVASGKMSLAAGEALIEFFNNWVPDAAWLSRFDEKSSLEGLCEPPV